MFADQPGFVARQMLLALIPDPLRWSIGDTDADSGKAGFELAFAFLQHSRLNKARWGKKNQRTAGLNQACRLSVTPSSLSSLECRRSDARTATNGYVRTCSLNKSAKVVLGRVLINSQMVTATSSMSALAHFAD